jgi:iron complex transport system ATP-binding protein
MSSSPAVHAALSCESLSYKYPDSTASALCDVTVSVPRGSFCGVIGPNGSGKSTLVRLLTAAVLPTSGIALIDGVPAMQMDRAEIARRIGVVTQAEEIVFPISVRDLVAMGRYPHLGTYRRESDADRSAVSRALSLCDLESFGARSMTALSGGERQLARIARALAQEPQTLILDEPTAALDIAHEMAIFELLSRLSRDTGVTVLLITHNVNLAARYAHALVLLDRGRVAAAGAASHVVTQHRIQSVYHWPVTVEPHAGPGRDTGAPQVVPLRKEDP